MMQGFTINIPIRTEDAEDVKEAYNAGYSDCECNHVSEASQYVHDLSYIKIQQQNKIIKGLNSGHLNKKRF